jgi:hypothetical protein
MSGYVPAHLRRLVAERADGLCEYCLIHRDDTFFGCEIEHVIAEKHGGLTTPENLALACMTCNRFKGSDIASLSERTAQLCRLFNPRTDRWSDHFKLDGMVIRGLTDVGEVTAKLLGFNDLDRLAEREALIAVRRYPMPAAAERMGRVV